MDQQQEKKEIISRIKGQIQRNIESGVSESPQNEAGASSSGGYRSSVGGGFGDSSESGKDADKSSKNKEGLGDRIRGKANEKANKLAEGAKNRVKNTDAYKLASNKLDAARAAKERYRQEAQKKVEKIIGERGRKALEMKRKANILRNKINRHTKKLKKALAVKAKKSHFSGGTVALITIITVVIALVVDVLDVVGELGFELGFIPTAIAYIINFVSSSIVFVAWFLVFSGSRGKGSKQTKIIIRTVLMLFGLENIPIIELLPFNAISVVLNYIDFKAGEKEANQ